MRKNVIILVFLILGLSLFFTGCTKYVCYNGEVQKDVEDCPLVPVPKVIEQDAGKYADNYGLAVAQAKHHMYTRVNMYNTNATWFANVLFTDSITGEINNVLLRIDGKTGDISCITGCAYFAPKTQETPESLDVLPEESAVETE